DTEEVVRKRFAEYEEKTRPVLGYYSDRGLVGTVNGVGSLDEVTARIRATRGVWTMLLFRSTLTRERSRRRRRIRRVSAGRETEGTVELALPKGLYRVRCDDGSVLVASLGGVARQVTVKIIPGDRV